MFSTTMIQERMVLLDKRRRGSSLGDVDPLLWRLQSGDLSHQLFVNDGTQIVQGGVPPDPIVEALNIFKGSLPGLSSRLKVVTVNAFSFEAVKEVLHRSIVVTIAGTASSEHEPFLL